MQAQVVLFFEASANGAAELKSLRGVHVSNTVVAMTVLACNLRGETGAVSLELARRVCGD